MNIHIYYFCVHIDYMYVCGHMYARIYVYIIYTYKIYEHL